ncbi:MAG: dicarboxylate/amino acid:cation symporter [Desulfovibrio desulfuricans]|jgi:Na+/H+-dicarboxylate symporter|uniref:dicarboxylate/amino acid:cation symporter n=1 Tax=uncultured Desulfovibrio sp. TaxID=167968 RepID=UPI0026165C72|nr:dicarboxylate/amino acid:cation symporter [uncultured Desulfovibrio sp.]MBE6441380.1 dicarboxylate/amino acid:cation symporter [Desulfovibrio desulfuricans]
MNNTFSSDRVEKATRSSLAENAKRKHLRTVSAWFAAMLIGGVLGYLQLPEINRLFGFIATVFTRLFQFVAVPVIALAVITTLSALGARRETGRIFAHAVVYTLTTTICAAAVALLLYIWVAPENVISFTGGSLPGNIKELSYYDHFLSVIPNNILQPFVSGNVLSVLLIAAAVGLALAFMPRTENREMLVKAINGLQELLFTLIRALLAVLPVGILAFTGQLVAQIETGVIVGALGQYTTVVIGGNLLQFFVVIPLFLLARGLHPVKVFRGMFPALAVALFSKSSAGTLPVTLASAEDNLRLDHRVTRFVLPICTTINMNGCAAFILVTSLFLMQNAGIAITAGTMCIWLFVAVLAAVGNAGVPMGCYFLTLSLMSSMNVPVDLMGVILPIYAIIDMIETCVNVWSDSSVAAMTNHDLLGKLPDDPEAQAAGA